MTRTHRKETYNQSGELVEAVETPWGRGDYLRAVAALEGQITERRKREALSDDAGGTAEGRAWMVAKNAEIQVLRNELNQLQ